MLGQLGLREPEPERRTTNHHPSPSSRMELHTMTLSKAIHEMSAFPDVLYELYSWEFYKPTSGRPGPSTRRRRRARCLSTWRSWGR